MYTIASNGTEGASHIWGPLVHFGRRYAPAMPASSRRRWPRQMAKKASSVGCGACREGIEACAIEPESGDLALKPADDAETRVASQPPATRTWKTSAASHVASRCTPTGRPTLLDFFP